MTTDTPAAPSFAASFRAMSSELFDMAEEHDKMSDPDGDRMRRLAQQVEAVADGLDAHGDGERDDFALDALAALARERDPSWAPWWSALPLWEQAGAREVAAQSTDGEGQAINLVSVQPLVRCPACHGAVEQHAVRGHAKWHKLIEEGES